MKYVVALLFVLQFVGTVIYLSLVYRLFSRLSKNHAAVWRELGEPALITNNHLRNNLLFLGWLWREDYRQLSGAPEDVALAARVRALLLTLLLTFVPLVALLVWVLS